MTNLADRVEINFQERTLTIDGVLFPWYMAECGPHAESLHVPLDEPFVVWVPVVTNRVHVVGNVEHPRPWCKCHEPKTGV